MTKGGQGSVKTREDLGIIEVKELPALKPRRLDVRAKLDAKALDEAQSDQLKLLATLEAMADADSRKRRNVAMLLMLI
jgi:hypothetical protein